MKVGNGNEQPPPPLTAERSKQGVGMYMNANVYMRKRQMKRYMLLSVMIRKNTSLEPQVYILVVGATIRDGKHYSGFW